MTSRRIPPPGRGHSRTPSLSRAAAVEPAPPPPDADEQALSTEAMRQMLSEKRAAGAPWGDPVPEPGFPGAGGEPGPRAGPSGQDGQDGVGGRGGEGQGESRKRQPSAAIDIHPRGDGGDAGGRADLAVDDDAVDDGEVLALSTRSAPAGQLAALEDDEEDEDEGYDEDDEDGEGEGDGSPVDVIDDDSFAHHRTHRRRGSASFVPPRHRRRPSAVADALSSRDLEQGLLLPPAIGQTGYESPPTAQQPAEPAEVAKTPTETSALLGTGAVPSMLLSPGAAGYVEPALRNAVSYGGTDGPFEGSPGVGRGGSATFEVLTGAHGGVDGFSYSDEGESQEDQAWMDSRAGSFDQRTETSQRAAAIIGSGSAVVFVVVLAVVISGLSALAGVDVDQRFDVFSDWPNGGTIPDIYGCLAPGGPSSAQSFPLAYNNIPKETTSLVVLVANPAAIKVTGRDPVHWFLTGISPKANGYGMGQDREPIKSSRQAGLDRLGRPWWIPANASANPSLLPPHSVQRANVKHVSGQWTPLCTFDGTPNMYVVYVFAVDDKPVIANFQDARQIMNRFSGVPTAKLAGYYGGKRGASRGRGKASSVHSSAVEMQNTTRPDSQVVTEGQGSGFWKQRRRVLYTRYRGT